MVLKSSYLIMEKR